SRLPSSAWTRRFVVTGKETFSLINIDNRRVTQLFVHELWLDHKGRLVRWHINGDAVAFVRRVRREQRNARTSGLVLPGEASSITHSIPPGMFYVQILRAQHLSPAEGDPQASSHSGATSSKKAYPVYVRCVLQEGTHTERTLDGLQISRDHWCR
ncbi:hypothetical protein PINS_up022224, partial [Pythium insidiosum]